MSFPVPDPILVALFGGGFTVGLFCGVELVLRGLRRLGLYDEFRKRQREELEIAHSN